LQHRVNALPRFRNLLKSLECKESWTFAKQLLNLNIGNTPGTGRQFHAKEQFERQSSI
jgi:hypothetical protein